MIFLQRFDGRVQRTGNLGNLRQFFGRQVVEVLVERVARVDLVENTVDTRKHDGREGEVAVAGRIGAAELDTLGLGAGRVHRDTAGRGAVALRVSQVHRRFVTRDQTLVAIHGRSAEGDQRGGVLQNTADVPQGFLGQAGVLVAREQGLAALPKTGVHVHAGAVVAVQGLGHEGDGLAVFLGYVLDDVLVHHQLVGHFHQRREFHIDFALAGGGDFVVMRFDVDAQTDQGRDHLGADILQSIDRRAGEIAFLKAGAVAQVGNALVILIAVPNTFFGIDAMVGVVRALAEAGVIENKELGFRSDVGGVGQAGGFHVLFALLSDVARVAAVSLLGDRVQNGAGDGHRRAHHERIDESGAGIRHDQHVAFVNRLPAADTGTVKAVTVFKRAQLQLVGRHGKVLPSPREVLETEVNEFDRILLDQFKNVFWCHLFSPSGLEYQQYRQSRKWVSKIGECPT